MAHVQEYSAFEWNDPARVTETEHVRFCEAGTTIFKVLKRQVGEPKEARKGEVHPEMQLHISH